MEHLTLLFYIVVQLAILRFLYKYFFPLPYEIIHKDLLDDEQRIRKRPAMRDALPPYPNGWFVIMESFDLKRGDTKHVKFLGHHFAVYRGESGKVSVLDAYCPHLGANLGAGGIVKGDCIQCPFHGWTFDSSGKCVKIPYSSSAIPPQAKTKSWPCQECNKQIMIWFDAEDRPPLWDPVVVPEVHDGSWTYRGKIIHYINAHIQEVPENGADLEHFRYLHDPFIVPGLDKCFRHVHDAVWRPGSKANGDEHLGYIDLQHDVSLFGKLIKGSGLHVKAVQIGPGLVNLYFESLFGKGVFCQSITPLGPQKQLLVHRFFAARAVPQFIMTGFMNGQNIQVTRDQLIWDNKTFVKDPVFVKEDAMLAKFRRWYANFYSENSSKFSSQEQNRKVSCEKDLDW